MGLVDDLQEQLGLEYLSNLNFLNYEKIKAALKSVSAEDYAVAEWNEAVEYLTKERLKFASSCEARAFLLNYKKE